MRLPFTDQDYARALSRAWPKMTSRQKVTLINVDLFSKTAPPAFQMVELANACGEPVDVFLSIMGRIGSLLAESLGMSCPPRDLVLGEVWYIVIFERIGGPRELVKLRTSFANSLKNLEGLPLQFVTEQEPEQ